MKLYVYDHCPFCTKARMIFGLKQEPLELVYLSEDDHETPTMLVGKKTAPILQKADGSHMPESMDIVAYIDARQGNSVVNAAESNELKTWHDGAWMPILRLAIPRLADADLPEFATPAARAAFRLRQTKNFGDFEALSDQSTALRRDVEERSIELAALLTDREETDADDFMLYPSLRMLSIVEGVSYPACVAAYMTKMEQRTGVALHTGQAR